VVSGCRDAINRVCTVVSGCRDAINRVCTVVGGCRDAINRVCTVVGGWALGMGHESVNSEQFNLITDN
jgi:hypothetical protein